VFRPTEVSTVVNQRVIETPKANSKSILPERQVCKVRFFSRAKLESIFLKMLTPTHVSGGRGLVSRHVNEDEMKVAGFILIIQALRICVGAHLACFYTRLWKRTLMRNNINVIFSINSGKEIPVQRVSRVNSVNQSRRHHLNACAGCIDVCICMHTIASCPAREHHLIGM
jgi:hypothetical protein